MAEETDDIGRAFLGAQDGERQATPALASAVAAAVDAGIAAWPDLRADRLGFASFLGQRIPSDLEPAEAFRGRALGELYLVFACLAGDPAGQRHLDDDYVKPLVGILVHQGMAHELARDTVQQLRMQLLAGERPILRAYSGLGALKGWLRITTLREAVRAQRRARAHEGDELNEALADAADDPALQYQRRLYQDEFRSAFEAAVGSLTVRERNLLKQSVLYGATVDDLGALYHVHRATAARWISAARERLAEETRRRMIEHLGIQPAEYDSILTLIHSQLDVSVRRVLGEPR